MNPTCMVLNLLAVLSLLISVSSVIVGAEIPTTLDGPFKPVTVPLDQSFRGQAVDLPNSNPRLQAKLEQFHPEQISVSHSFNYDSVWISWITGEFQIGDNIEPLDPNSVASIVQFGEFGKPITEEAESYSLVYSQLYPFQGLQNYTSGLMGVRMLKGASL
ncbi:hypothetical protein K1719_044304 [Acacia pycnantha]|nr:hypothetical protein K1719_044304 [Acacia pycnantha]